MGYAASLKNVQEQTEEKSRSGCYAHGCPFPAGLSAGAGAPSFCRHHHSVPSVRWPNITESMTHEHGALLQEVLSARRYFASGAPGSEAERLEDAWTRLRRHGYDLDPANCVQRNGERRPATTYRLWSGAAEEVLAGLLRKA
jgi:hypothetical protein